MIWLLWACTGELDEPVTSLPNEDPLEPAVVPDGGEPLEEIAASHILVKYEGASGSVGITRSRGQALEMIEEARARIVAGEDFRVVASEVSNDSSSVRGGWIGVGDYSTWVPEFSDVAFALDAKAAIAVQPIPRLVAGAKRGQPTLLITQPPLPCSGGLETARRLAHE